MSEKKNASQPTHTRDTHVPSYCKTEYLDSSPCSPNRPAVVHGHTANVHATYFHLQSLLTGASACSLVHLIPEWAHSALVREANELEDCVDPSTSRPGGWLAVRLIVL